MQDRQNHELPEQSALTDENTVSAQETTLDASEVCGHRGADPGRLGLRYISAEDGCHFARSQPHQRQGRQRRMCAPSR